MLIVDSHCHAGTSWFEPIESLLFQMDRNDVHVGVLIQHRGVYDNAYLLDCVRRFPGRFVVAAMVGSSRPEATADLERWAEQGAVAVRLGPTERSPGSDPLAIWRTASELGLAVSSLGEPDQFASNEFRDLLAALPELTVVIEHLAGVNVGARPADDAYKRALELATYPNTYIKTGGLGEISARPPVLRNEFGFDETPPLIDMALEAFGPRRMMWGSDFPPVSNREGYRNALRGVMDHPALRSDDDREWVMGRTAAGVFQLR